MVTSETNPVQAEGHRSATVVTQIESAVRAVRVLLCVLACFVLVAHRPFTRSPNWVLLAIVVSSVIATTATLNSLSLQAERRHVRSTMSMAIGQILDVAAAVGLVIALDAPLQGQAYVLLVIPVVSGSVRHGSASAMLSWAGGSAAYAALSLTGVVDVPDSFNFLVRTSGILLVIAATVGILARWMREGWEIQSELTEAAAAREKRLSTIEAAARSMARLPADEALAVCLQHTLKMPFDAASRRAHDQTQPAQAFGQGDIVSALNVPEALIPGQVVLTKWMTKEKTPIYSASVLEPQTENVVTGWSVDEIAEDQANALATLVAQTSTAIETSTLLSQLRTQAANDALTGLPNRRTFDEALQGYANSTSRLAVAFVDVDYFKQVNDAYGHAAGDHVLKIIAQRLHGAVPAGDIVARIGGDEFVCLLRDTDPDSCQRVGEAIATAMRSPIVTDNKPLFMTLSIGFALGTAPLAPEDLVETADGALYEAKEAGRNRIIYSLMPQPAPPLPEARTRIADRV